ncbi:hypothetical protein GCK32_005892 [Trichostrongylus colubriformis]|uniref:Uncharacterized protein n=1 Tax=Trichostrongylus colubriformis TaxID=6319 RepID=A0AAN8FEZ1_TRICO
MLGVQMEQKKVVTSQPEIEEKTIMEEKANPVEATKLENEIVTETVANVDEPSTNQQNNHICNNQSNHKSQEPPQNEERHEEPPKQQQQQQEKEQHKKSRDEQSQEQRPELHPQEPVQSTSSCAPTTMVETSEDMKVPLIAVSRVESVKTVEGAVGRLLTAVRSRSLRRKKQSKQKSGVLQALNPFKQREQMYKSRSENRARKALRTITFILDVCR